MNESMTPTQLTLHYQADEARHMQLILDGETIFDETVEPLAERPPLAFGYQIAATGAHHLVCKDVTNSLDMDKEFSTPEIASVVIFIESDTNGNSIAVNEGRVSFK